MEDKKSSHKYPEQQYANVAVSIPSYTIYPHFNFLKLHVKQNRFYSM